MLYMQSHANLRLQSAAEEDTERVAVIRKTAVKSLIIKRYDLSPEPGFFIA